MKPVSTGAEIKLAITPSCNAEATTSIPPTRTASVAEATSSSSRLPPGATPTNTAAVNMAIVDVALTLRGREVPSRA